MKTNNLNFCLLVIVSAGLFLTIRAEGKVETDQQAVAALVDRFTDAWNRHDAHAFAAVFADDADFTNWRGTSASDDRKLKRSTRPCSQPFSRTAG